MTRRPGDGLRDLARSIESVCIGHPELSRAGPIIANCTDHLLLLARVADYQQPSVDKWEQDPAKRSPDEKLETPERTYEQLLEDAIYAPPGRPPQKVDPMKDRK